MTQRLYRAVLVACAVIVCAAYGRATYRYFQIRYDHRLPLGQRAPDFRLPTASAGEVKSLADWRGQAVYLMFMATDCGVSQEALPILEAWAAQHPAVTVIAIGREDGDTLGAYATPFPHITFLSDVSTAVWQAYHIEATPTAYVLDAQGYLRYSVIGGPARPDQLDLHVQFLNTDWSAR